MNFQNILLENFGVVTGWMSDMPMAGRG